MGLTVCPVAVVAAPIEVVWENLVQLVGLVPRDIWRENNR